MDQARQAILRPRQAAYLEGLGPARAELLLEMEELARRKNLTISAPPVGRLLSILVQATAARRVLEIGTGIGYACVSLTSGSESVRVTSIDRDAEMLRIATGFIERCEVAERVELLCGEAVDQLRSVQGPYDMCFIDTDPRDCRRCLDLGLQVLRVGGLVIANNLLWRGLVAEPGLEGDRDSEDMRAFGGYFVMYPQLESIVLPVAGGVGLAVKSTHLTTDVGGPF